MDAKTLRIGISLGAISAAGPLGIDMYLGALPQMARDFGGGSGELRLSVMTFFAGFALGQLFYGPASDRLGRKPMICLGLAVYCLGSVGCALADGMTALFAWRFVEGLGGSIGLALSTAVIRDLYAGRTAAQMMTVVVAIQGVAPSCAPLAGSLLLGIAGWRLIFAVLAAFSVAAALLTLLVLPETRSPELRAASRPEKALKTYAGLLASGEFMPYAAALALAQGGFFAYIGGSSFVFIDVYGLSPVAYSLVFCLNTAGLIAGSALGARWSRRFGFAAVAKAAAGGFALAALALLLLGLNGAPNIAATCVLFLAAICSLGGVMPTCTVLAMEAHGGIAGTAAALLGSLGFGAGAAAIIVMGAGADGGPLSLFATIAACACASALVANLLFPARAPMTR